jgi:hypothetical protein
MSLSGRNDEGCFDQNLVLDGPGHGGDGCLGGLHKRQASWLWFQRIRERCDECIHWSLDRDEQSRNERGQYGRLHRWLNDGRLKQRRPAPVAVCRRRLRVL